MPSCGVCVCICLSVTFMSCVKTNKDIFDEIFSPSGSQAILVFPCQTGWRYSDGNSANGGVECRWGRQKTWFWTNICLRCIQVYSVVNRTNREVWKIKPRRTAASSELSTHGGVRHPLFAQDNEEVLWLAWRYTSETEVKSPGHNPLVITPFSAAVGHRRTEPGGYFCWKLTLTRTPNPIRRTRRGPDPNQPTNGRKQGGYDLRVFVRGVLVGHRRRQ